MNNNNLEKMAQNYVKFRVYSEIGGLAGMATGYLISSMMNSMDKRNKEEKKEENKEEQYHLSNKASIILMTLLVLIVCFAMNYAKH